MRAGKPHRTQRADRRATAFDALVIPHPTHAHPVRWALPRSANAAFVALLHAKHTSDASVRSACLSWAQRQLDYMLGLAGSER